MRKKQPKPTTTTLSIEKQLARGPLDLPFLALTLLLVGIGLIMLYSASAPRAYYTGAGAASIFLQQAQFAALGIVAMYTISRFNYQHWRGLSILLMIAAVVLMLLILVPGLGVNRNGATRWLNLGFTQFQPSEVTKFAVILFFSTRLSKRQTGIRSPYSRRTRLGRVKNMLHDSGFLELIPYGVVLALVVFLLYLQPHMSATIQILAVAAALLFAAGIGLKWFFSLGVVVLTGLGIIIATTDYMTSRMQMWLDPWIDPLDKGLQAIQSLIAIGSGGLTGLGFGNGRQKFLYLPEEHNDFIFAVVCEELGLIGAGLILTLFALLIIRGYWLALHARDRFGSLLIVGVTTLLAFQVFLNVAVVSNLFPVTGISLPFFSYGGTALLIQMAEMGVVLAVSRQIPAHKSG